MKGGAEMDTAEIILSPEQEKVFENMPIPFCVLHAQADNYDLLAVSDGLCRLLHRTRSELMDAEHHLLQLVAADDRRTVIDALEYARVQPGTACHTSYHFLYGSENIKADCCNIAEALSDGSYLIYVYFSGCAKQIGINEAAEDPVSSLNGSQDLLNLDSSENKIAEWLVDLTDNKVISYQKLQMRGMDIDLSLPFDACVKQAAESLHAEEGSQKFSAVIQREIMIQNYQRGHTSFAVQYRRDEDGKMPFWVSLVVQMYVSAQSGHIICSMNAYDITEKILEKQMISRFTMLGYDIVGLLGVPSRKVRFFRLKPMQFGMSYEHYQDYLEAIDGDVDRVVAEDQREAVSHALRLETILEELKEKPIYEYSFEVTTSDGRHRHKLLQYSYLNEDHDTIFLCRSDVTSQYQREHAQIEELRAAKLAADRANEAKSSFLSSVSHDLRTPLNGVVGFTELALNEKDPEVKQGYIQKVKLSSTLLLDLVNDTLELSRIESGKSVYSPEAAGLRSMSEAVLTSLQPSAEIKSLTFVTDLTQCPDVIVWTDRLKFQKIFLNLLSNAIKYTPSGGRVEACVRWDEKNPEGYTCHLSVKDNGIGIRREFLPHIFESFSQDQRPETRNIQGTGLGLAIVKRIVTQLNGQISVDSKEGEGSEFKVDLPLTPADQNEKIQAENKAEIKLAGRHILLCEDNPLNTEIAKVMLSSAGAHVDTAANGEEGVEMFKASSENYYDAVLMDIRMPFMDGLDASRTIREMDRKDAGLVPIIAMTADAFEEDIEHCHEAGMQEHITKPINPDSLYKVLSKCIYDAEQTKLKNSSKSGS